jgi:hypothetical protein
MRGWTAGILVAVYAFVVLAPSLAFSFDGHASIIHSLTEIHGGQLTPHIHHDKADGKGSDKQSPADVHHCCGVLFVSGFPPPTAISFVDRDCVSLIPSVSQDRHAGCGPIRLDRPPRLSSLI